MKDSIASGTPTALHQAASMPRRAAAYLLDIFIFSPYIGALIALGAQFPSLRVYFVDSEHAELLQFLLLTFPLACWFVGFESSQRRATPGKALMRFEVFYDGTLPRISAATLRNSLKLFPWELSHAALWRIRFAHGEIDWTAGVLIAITWILVLTYVVGAASNRKHHQTPYDTLASAVVLNTAPVCSS